MVLMGASMAAASALAARSLAAWLPGDPWLACARQPGRSSRLISPRPSSKLIINEKLIKARRPFILMASPLNWHCRLPRQPAITSELQRVFAAFSGKGEVRRQMC